MSNARNLRVSVAPWPIYLCVLCVLCGNPAEAAVDDYLGKPVASVRLLIEGRETTETALARVIETHVGQALSMADVRESITHLFSFGRFDDVRVDASVVDGDRVALRYELEPIHPIARIEFAGRLGAPGVDQRQLRRAVTDRYGVSPPLGRATELAQVVAGMLRARGYLHADVKPRIDTSHATERATLIFMIDPGPRTAVGSMDIVGTPEVPRAEFLDRLGLAPGVAYESDLLDQRIERYVAGRRKLGYYEAKLARTVRLADDDRVANLTLTLTPGSRVRIVFTGDPLPSDKRTELVPIEREGSVDEDLLEDATNRIEDYLRAQGYRDAVAPHARQVVNGELHITFGVTRGPEYRVDRVEVSGNPSAILSDFERALRLRAGQPFSTAKLDADVGTIEDLYHRRGFATAKAQPAVEPQGGETGARLVPVAVRIVVTEGVRTLVTSVHVEGNLSVAAGSLTDGLGLQAGRPYFDRQLALDRDAILLQYFNRGYPGAVVEANPHFSADRTEVEPVFTIREGPRVVVDHVLIVGNARTSTDTIARELQIQAGDALSPAAVTESQRRLATLGLFRRIRFGELRRGDETTRDLVVTVEEAPARTVGGGGGLEVRQRLVRRQDDPGVASERLEFAPRGSFETGWRNFFGKNRSVNLFTSASLHPRASPFFAGQSISATGDTGEFGFTEYRVLGQFREPKLFGTSADLLIAVTFEQQIRSSFNFSRRGASAEVARRVTRDVSLSGNYQIQRTRVFDVNVDPSSERLIDRLFSQVRLSSFSSSAVRDTRDDPVEPASGEYLSASVQIAGRQIGSEVGFAKTFMRAQLFRTPARAKRIVLAGNANLGLATGFPRDVVTTDGLGNVTTQTVDDLPASERFFAGGDAGPVRGFALDALGAPETLDKDGFPIGGNATVIVNAEVRALVRGDISAVGFVDAGNVFARAADIDLTGLRTAVGFGLRYKSPVGPIRVDLGFKVHRQPGEGLTSLHLSFAQAF